MKAEYFLRITFDDDCSSSATSLIPRYLNKIGKRDDITEAFVKGTWGGNLDAEMENLWNRATANLDSAHEPTVEEKKEMKTKKRSAKDEAIPRRPTSNRSSIEMIEILKQKDELIKQKDEVFKQKDAVIQQKDQVIEYGNVVFKKMEVVVKILDKSIIEKNEFIAEKNEFIKLLKETHPSFNRPMTTAASVVIPAAIAAPSSSRSHGNIRRNITPLAVNDVDKELNKELKKTIIRFDPYFFDRENASEPVVSHFK